jgi:hypothetical protein
MIIARGSHGAKPCTVMRNATLQQVGTPLSRGMFTGIECDPLVSTATNELA